MAIEFKLPDLGEGIESAEVIKVNVKVGDTIAEDDPVLEIETDKAATEVPTTESGTVTEVLVKKGDTVEVGQPIFMFEADNGDSAETESNESASEETSSPQPAATEDTAPGGEGKDVSGEDDAAPKIIDFELPDLGEGIDGADVVGLLVQAGDSVDVDDGILEIETDKATAEVPISMAGTIKKWLVKKGDTIKVGQPILQIETSGSSSPDTKADKATSDSDSPSMSQSAEASRPAPPSAPDTTVPPAKPARLLPETHSSKRLIPAAPTTRRFAREIGIDIAQVPGTGPGGRISINDVKRYSQQLRQQGPVAVSGGVGIPVKDLPDFSKWGEVEVEDMSKIRRLTAENLSYAWQSIPHVTQHDKADITELEKLRKQFGNQSKAAGAKLTITAILAKVVAAALKKFPQFNASVDMKDKKPIFKKYINIGIAVDTERGLLVPVIRDADQKSILEIAQDLTEISEKARDRKLSVADMQGGTFTISNLGGIGGTAFTPIVNWPEVAILGASRGSYEPVYTDGEFVPRLMMPLSLSYDHRIIDGADAARFQRWVCEALEQPFKVLFEG